ncbi:hypothetical protein RRG08_033858 [Elysia crispata]|uniref:E3 ubiquitin-protein ligase parkin n=1 Tax=Elysia crispata TaxID=231223 RepID=A0AAE1B9Z6_9GAST|nr:hypothetical protein RRG08_033858 [Elysia crispata]
MASNSLSNQGLEGIFDDHCGSNTICFAVKFSSNRSYVVDISAGDSIKDLKAVVARKAGLCADDIHFVLAGQRLQDCKSLQSCGVGSHTTLHAFCRPIGNVSKASPKTEQDYGSDVDHFNYNGEEDSGICKECICSEVNFAEQRCSGSRLKESQDVEGIQDINSYSCEMSRPLGYNRFFVYCKLCDGIRPAKLRLVCKGCCNGAFLVDRGPSNWQDISSTTSITGRCTVEKCDCKTPRFYLRCFERHEGDVDGTAVALKHVNMNRRRVDCIACGDVVSPVLIFPCEVGHVICLACFRQYCSVSLNERRFTEHERHGYTLPCPAGCPESYIEESHHFLLLGKENYERYKNFGAEEYVLQNGGMLCPAPGCGMGLFPENGTRLIKCGECQFESCKDCKKEYHTGSCHEVESIILNGSTNIGISDEMAQRACWEMQSMNLIEETTKSCPNCRSKTERNGGCMHMVCSRCECEWCWICVKPWTRDCMAQHWFG